MHQFDEFFTYTYFPFSDSKSLKKKKKSKFLWKVFHKMFSSFFGPGLFKIQPISNNLKASNELHVPILVH